MRNILFFSPPFFNYPSIIYNELCKIVNLVTKTDGGTTSNRRIDWNIPKSHSNDSIVITGLKPDTTNLYGHTIQPLRKKRKCKLDKSLGIVQGDSVLYTPRGKSPIKCYVTAILKSGKLKSSKVGQDHLIAESEITRVLEEGER